MKRFTTTIKKYIEEIFGDSEEEVGLFGEEELNINNENLRKSDSSLKKED